MFILGKILIFKILPQITGIWVEMKQIFIWSNNKNKRNFQEFYELIHYSNFLESNGKFLYTIDRQKSLKLTTYQSSVYEYLYFCERENILNLVRSYLNEELQISIFIEKFQEIINRTETKFNEIKTNISELKKLSFQLDENDNQKFVFSELITEISNYCLDFEFKEDISVEYQMNDDEFFTLLESVYPELESICTVEFRRNKNCLSIIQFIVKLMVIVVKKIIKV